MQGNSHIPRAPGPRASQTILIIVFCEFVVWVIIWEDWICLRIIENTRNNAHPKGPGTLGPPNHISYYIQGIGGLDYHLGELNLSVYHSTKQWKLHIPKIPGPLAPQTILIIIFWCSVVWIIMWANLICLFIIVHIRTLYVPRVPGPRVPQTILVTIFCDLVAWIIIWENLICLFIIERAREIAYTKGPGTPGPPNHIIIFLYFQC